MASIRKDPLATGRVYHIFNKSIAGFKIFNYEPEFSRMLKAIRYYQRRCPGVKFSRFIVSGEEADGAFDKTDALANSDKLVEIIAYCLMPTHMHFILKQLNENGISIFMSNIQNSFVRYFNTKIKRSGPLWVSRFKNVLVKTDAQLLHLTRYLHLNPVTAYLVDDPEYWPASSYREFLSNGATGRRLCRYEDDLDIDPKTYQYFVKDGISYQRALKLIKDLIFE